MKCAEPCALEQPSKCSINAAAVCVLDKGAAKELWTTPRFAGAPSQWPAQEVSTPASTPQGEADPGTEGAGAAWRKPTAVASES